MISFSSAGDTNNLEKFLQWALGSDVTPGLEAAAQRGVDALSAATPRASGLTAESWIYEIIQVGDHTTIWWKNMNVVEGFNVAVGLQYGHGTGTGGWIPGYDYINPALQPVLDAMANDIWEEVQKA